ncbi:hypothetical protein ACIRBX_24450 [Kitasatospora sp. NPDC096147]|uniref:hypothetical protein n=1 Tax=Kitasatospora sp. NPDC096147 TaxID=3364093 RepID=UPI00381AD696
MEDVPFGISVRLAGRDAPVELTGVAGVTLRLPGSPEIVVAQDHPWGVAFRVESLPDATHFHQFELRPGAGNLLFLRVHSYPRQD